MEANTCKISDWKTIPSDAKITALVFGKYRRPVSSLSHILVEYCYCVSTFHNAMFHRMMKTGRFSNWLSYSPTRVRRPVKCCDGLYVEASDSLSTIGLRLCLLSSAFGAPEDCSLEYDCVPKERSQDLVVEQFYGLKEDRAACLSPVNIVFGKKKYSVKSWTDCLPVFRNIVRTQLPFGEALTPSLPSGYLAFKIGKVLSSMVDMIKAASVDRYSVSVECLLVSESILAVPKEENEKPSICDEVIEIARESEAKAEVESEGIRCLIGSRHFSPRVTISI